MKLAGETSLVVSEGARMVIDFRSGSLTFQGRSALKLYFVFITSISFITYIPAVKGDEGGIRNIHGWATFVCYARSLI